MSQRETERETERDKERHRKIIGLKVLALYKVDIGLVPSIAYDLLSRVIP